MCLNKGGKNRNIQINKMKVAITSSGSHLESPVDRYFGRAPFYVIYNTVDGGYEIFPNPNSDSPQGAGTASAELLSGRGVEKVVSGEFGVHVKSLFDQLKIQLISVPDEKKSIQQIINLLKNRHQHESNEHQKD